MGNGSGRTADNPALHRADDRPGWVLALSLYLADRPGELAEISSAMAAHGANIEKFLYNRSQDPHLVGIEAYCPRGADAGALIDYFDSRNNLDRPKSQAATGGARITDAGGLLKLKLSLEDRPGTLAAVADILKKRKANVIYMAYDGHKAPGLAEMSVATASAEEISALLETLSKKGYHYHVEWKGGENAAIDQVIGLNAVESFLFKLKSILPPDRLSALDELLRSSDELRETLLGFRREAGESDEAMAASEVFTNILHLAAASVTKTGRNFSLRLTGPMPLTDKVSQYMLTCPTGANAFLLRGQDGLALIDSSYGLYFSDVMDWLSRHGLDPGKISRALFTHADADHAGWAAPLEEAGTEIYMHPGCRDILDRENRALGSDTRLGALNHYYTLLINRFTDMRAPKNIRAFDPGTGEIGGFSVIGKFAFEDLELFVLESLGGHIPATVFFFSPEHGLLYCGDYLIDIASLSDRAKSTLSIARFLMTSTNTNSRVFAREMDMLKDLMRKTNADALRRGFSARVFPGHGDFFTVDEAGWD